MEKLKKLKRRQTIEKTPKKHHNKCILPNKEEKTGDLPGFFATKVIITVYQIKAGKGLSG